MMELLGMDLLQEHHKNCHSWYNAFMKQRITNYTVIINKEKRLGTDLTCFSAFVPTLGIATDANTLDQVQKAVKELIEFHLESLTQEGEKIPVEDKSLLVARSEVTIPENGQIATN